MLCPARTGDADATNDHDSVNNGKAAGYRHNAATVGDGEAAQPMLPCLGRQFGGGKMEGRRRVSLMESELCRPGLRAIHSSDGDRIAGLIYYCDSYSDAHRFGVFLG